jgi:hypothetical protein
MNEHENHVIEIGSPYGNPLNSNKESQNQITNI